MRCWTDEWTHAAGLALSSWTRRKDLFADERTARLLELVLEAVVLRERLVLHAYVILPSALHVIAGRSAGHARTGLPWPVALGRVKGTFARWRNEMEGGSGPAWRERVRVAPLAPGALREAVVRCHEAPVKAGLARFPEEYEFSSARRMRGSVA